MWEFLPWASDSSHCSSAALLSCWGNRPLAQLLQHLFFSVFRVALTEQFFKKLFVNHFSKKRCAWHALAWSEHVSFQCWESHIKIFNVIAVQVCSFFKLPLNAVVKSCLFCDGWCASCPDATLQLFCCSKNHRKKPLFKFCVINVVVMRRNGMKFGMLQVSLGLLLL